ncbi:MAG: response regulator [Alphaproteobacteria bacterium]|nr:response regulator [Alphaproteobacteria bacterium]
MDQLDYYFSLEDLELLDAPPEDTFDNLTTLAQMALRTPVTLMSIVDIDGDRQFFKSQLGLPEPWASLRQTPLSHSFCKHVVRTCAPLVVENAGEHPLVCDNGAVLDLNVNAYLGVPIFAQDNPPVGALCAIDTKARPWTENDILTLKRFASCISDAIQLKAALKISDGLAAERNAALVAAERAAGAKARFLALMSHEIRTPLNGVLGTLGLLREMPMPDDQRALVRTASESGEFLLGLLNDILDFSKLEAGQLQMEEAPCDITQILDGAAALYKAQIESKGLRLTVDIRPDVPQCIKADAGRIRQIILNYLSNAIKFTTDGEVALRVETRPQDDSRVGLCFSVQDSGIGIPPDKATRLFNDFQQIDETIARRFGGTGLGLSIIKLLAKQMDGEVWFESVVGQGSKFYFAAPFEVAEETAKASSGAEPDRSVHLIRDKLRVLLVEDNRTNQMVAKATLQRLGCNVDVAGNGLEAVEAVVSRPYDVVLMDVNMPELDGLEATRRIRRRADIPASLPIIALTANAMAEDRTVCIDAGMNDFVTKPIDKNVIAQKINQVVGKISVATQ